MPAWDPVALAQALVRAPSVTPDPGEAIGLCADWLQTMGAELYWVHEVPDVPNLVARLGQGGKRLAFGCHTDVVPPGASDTWQTDPFSGALVDGRLCGRGACDMKGGLAAAIAAAGQVMAGRAAPGELWFYITGDEEGASVHGSAAIVRWLRAQGLGFDGCIVTEPTSTAAVGDTIKLGRRGSLNARLTVTGRQGHTAFPHLADNPVHRLARIVTELAETTLDGGTERFEPSTLQVSTIDVGNPATNVIPAAATAALNIRFNTEHARASLETWLNAVADRQAPGMAVVEVTSCSEAFLCDDKAFTRLVADTVVTTLGRAPQPSTGGGTSDARFFKALGPVVELGSIGHSLHQTDEWIGLDELADLATVYAALIKRFLDDA